MAKKTQSKGTVPSKESFAEILFKIGDRFSLSKVFDDFLTMAIASCTLNPETKLSWYEDEYLATIAHYKDSDLRFEFPSAFAQLIIEMEEANSLHGGDVLGSFFEQNITHGRNGQFFTPYPVCQFMASITLVGREDSQQKQPLKIVDPACGSGRMLLAAHRINGPGNQYYGIDIDRTCVKMTALNLFLHGMWESEVMCADALDPDDFVISYRISFAPLGIFKVEEKEQSLLWNMHRNSFRKENTTAGSLIPLDPTPFSERPKDNSSQLDLFS